MNFIIIATSAIILTFDTRLTTATQCSVAVGNTYPVMNMCESGSVTNRNIILDTFNAASHGRDSCTCDIKIHTSSDVITVDSFNDLVPNIPNCGSEVVIHIEETSKKSSTNHMTCFVSKETFEVFDSYDISVSWNLNSSTSDSQYCLKVSSRDSSVTISCDSHLTTTTPFTGFSMTEPTSIVTSKSYSTTPVTASDGIASTTATTTSDRTSTMPTSTSSDVTTTHGTDESTSTSTSIGIFTTDITTRRIITTLSHTSSIPSTEDETTTHISETSGLNVISSDFTTTSRDITSISNDTTDTSKDITRISSDATTTYKDSTSIATDTTTTSKDITSIAADTTTTATTSNEYTITPSESTITEQNTTLLMSITMISTIQIDSSSTQPSSDAGTSVTQSTEEVITTDGTSAHTKIPLTTANTTIPEETSKVPEKLDSLVVIVAPAAGCGALVLVIIIIGIIVICRRKSNTPVQKIDMDGFTDPNDEHVDGSGQDGMIANTLYVSADVANPQHNTNSEDTTIKTEPDNKRDSMVSQQSTNSNDSVTGSKPNHVYAVVEKSKKTVVDSQENSNGEMRSITTVNGVEIPDNGSYIFSQNNSYDNHTDSRNKNTVTVL